MSTWLALALVVVVWAGAALTLRAPKPRVHYAVFKREAKVPAASGEGVAR